MVAGVCGGIARYLGVDSSLVRLAFGLLALIPPGVGLVAYVVACVAIPEERAEPHRAATSPANPDRDLLLLGGVLLAAGAALLLDRVGLLPGVERYATPLVVMLLGAALIAAARRRGNRS